VEKRVIFISSGLACSDVL